MCKKYNGRLVCGKCGSEKYSMKIVDRIDYIVTEQERICDDCGNLIDYWSYGNWESENKDIE